MHLGQSCLPGKVIFIINKMNQYANLGDFPFDMDEAEKYPEVLWFNFPSLRERQAHVSKLHRKWLSI